MLLLKLKLQKKLKEDNKEHLFQIDHLKHANNTLAVRAHRMDEEDNLIRNLKKELNNLEI